MTRPSSMNGLREQMDRTVAVYHLGGGTFDISILDVEDGVFEARSTSDETNCGSLITAQQFL